MTNEITQSKSKSALKVICQQWNVLEENSNKIFRNGRPKFVSTSQHNSITSNNQVMLRNKISGEMFPCREGVFCISNQGDYMVLPFETAINLENTKYVNIIY